LELEPVPGALRSVPSVAPHPICEPVPEFLSENGRHMTNHYPLLHDRQNDRQYYLLGRLTIT
jgi:hypothetical protein